MHKIDKLKKETFPLIIHTSLFVELFATKTIKKTYKKNRKLAQGSKNKILKDASQYCEIYDLTKGKYLINEIYDKKQEKRQGFKHSFLYLQQFFDNPDLLQDVYEEYDFMKMLNVVNYKEEKIENILDSLKEFVVFDVFEQNNKKYYKINNINYVIPFTKLSEKGRKVLQYISVPDFFHVSGVYKIYNDTKIYIGSAKDLYHRYAQHCSNYDNVSEKTFDILQNSGVFEVIEFFYDLDLTTKHDINLQKREYEIIKDYIFKYTIGEETRELINKVIPNSDGKLINLGDGEKRIRKYFKYKIKKEDRNICEKLMKDNGIWFDYC